MIRNLLSRRTAKALAFACALALPASGAHAFFFWWFGPPPAEREPDIKPQLAWIFPDGGDGFVPRAVLVKVRNVGDGRVTEPVGLEVYLSADKAFDAGDLLVGTGEVRGNIRPHRFRFDRVRLNVPEGADVPGLNLVVKATVGDGTSEGNTDNNVAVSDVILKIIDGSTLTVLHSNDGESQLVNAGDGLEDFGGIARFATVVENAKDSAASFTDGFVLISAGDTYIPSPEIDASLDTFDGPDPVIFDAIGLDAIDFDAFIVGNHDFDFGPNFFAEFIESFPSGESLFLTANLDFSGEPALDALVDAGRLGAASVIEVNGMKVGVVGATTPALPTITSPGAVIAVDADGSGNVDLEDVRIEVQAQIDALEGMGVNKIIFVSHLQGLDRDRELIPQLEGVDIAIAGGGDELLANPGDLLLPGDEPDQPYPELLEGAAGNTIPVVTTAGEYRYLGRLVATFDKWGNLIAFDGGPIRVSGTGEDAVEPDAFIQANVVDPVQDFLDALAATVIADQQVALDGRRDGSGLVGIRNVETNLGNLVADSFLFAGEELAPGFGVPVPDVAFANGGGIRNSSLIPPGDFTLKTAGDILPFANFVTVVPDISPAQFKQLLERGVSGRPEEEGRFLQIAGFSIIYDSSFQAQETNVDEDGNLTIVTPGNRVRQVTLDDGTVLVANGSVVPGAPDVTIATVDFLARGGDAMPFFGAPFTQLGITYKNALIEYIETPVADGGLGGVISAADYPEGGEGRITEL